MSWGHLRECKLGDVVVHVRRISGSRARGLARFRYPGRDGAEHEDTGREPRTFTLDAVCMDTVTGTYRMHWDALEELFEAGSRVTFVHPHKGTYTMRIERLQDTTSTEGARFIEATIDLIEDVAEEAGFMVTDGGLAGALNVFDTAAAAATTALAALP